MMETKPIPPVRDHNQDDAATGFMKPASYILLFVLCVLVAGCASTNYSAFEGGRVVEGTGGTKKTVDGIDIWETTAHRLGSSKSSGLLMIRDDKH